ncbi:MAG: HAMP domain-containing protein, partial [Magnetospirillum sp.]|nr:HAMP domain-containing protein [Magnetospirillum sp.]
MRIRSFFFLCMSAVTAVALLAAFGMVAEALSERTKVSAARDIAVLQGKLLALAEFVNLERGSHNLTLNTPQPVSADTAAKLAREREATDKAFAETQASALPALVSPLSELQRKLGVAREAMLRELVKPPTERDPGAANAWVAGNIKVGEGLIAEGNTLLQELSGLDGNVADFVMQAHSAAALRHVVGQRNTVLLNVIVSGRPMTTEQNDRHFRFSGRLEQIWDGMKAATSFLETDDKLKSAMTAVEAGIFGEVQGYVRQMEEASRAAQPYPMSAAEYRQRTVSRFAVIGELRDAYVARSLEVADARLGALNGRLAFAVTILLLLVALSVTVLVIFTRRVVSPLMATAGAISEMARDNLDVAVPGRDRSDEIGEIGHALETLRQNALSARGAEIERAADRADREKARQNADQQSRVIADRMENLMVSVNGNVSALRENAGTLTRLANEAADGSSSVASSAEEAAVNVQAIASATEQLLASIGEISQVVTSMATTANQAVEEAGNSK